MARYSCHNLFITDGGKAVIKNFAVSNRMVTKIYNKTSKKHVKSSWEWVESHCFMKKVPNFIFTYIKVSFMMRVISISSFDKLHREIDRQ